MSAIAASSRRRRPWWRDAEQDWTEEARYFSIAFPLLVVYAENFYTPLKTLLESRNLLVIWFLLEPIEVRTDNGEDRSIKSFALPRGSYFFFSPLSLDGSHSARASLRDEKVWSNSQRSWRRGRDEKIGAMTFSGTGHHVELNPDYESQVHEEDLLNACYALESQAN